VRRVWRETEEARSFVLEVPGDLKEKFAYRPGQFSSFRVHIGEVEHFRCYSMSSAPEPDGDLTFTVKRVPGGTVSNWLVDHVSEGDFLEVNPPSGNFCAREGGRPIVAFCGGSGITPVMSITQSLLATSARSVRLLYANRDVASVIFRAQLEDLSSQCPERIHVHHHLDVESGFVDAAAVAAFVDGCTDADFYICGPGPFNDLVEAALVGLGVRSEAIAVERFETAADPPAVHAGNTVLETARRADLVTPSSCQAGNCATCMAFVQEGAVTMRVNDALTADEVDEGWVLTCQAVPASPSLTVEFESL
jgi:ferredoxin-NADP reductase